MPVPPFKLPESLNTKSRLEWSTPTGRVFDPILAQSSQYHSAPPISRTGSHSRHPQPPFKTHTTGNSHKKGISHLAYETFISIASGQGVYTHTQLHRPKHTTSTKPQAGDKSGQEIFRCVEGLLVQPWYSAPLCGPVRTRSVSVSNTGS